MNSPNIWVLGLTILLTAGGLSGQTSGRINAENICPNKGAAKETCEELTPQMREKLVERVKAFVEYHRSNDKDKLYGFLFKPKFLRETIEPHWKLLNINKYNFYISGRIKTGGNSVPTYFTHFCIDDNSKKGKNYTQYIYWSEGDWYFQTWLTGIYIEGVDEPTTCRLD